MLITQYLSDESILQIFSVHWRGKVINFSNLVKLRKKCLHKLVKEFSETESIYFNIFFLVQIKAGLGRTDF